MLTWSTSQSRGLWRPCDYEVLAQVYLTAGTVGPQTQSVLISAVPEYKVSRHIRNWQSSHIGFQTHNVMALLVGKVTQKPPELTLLTKIINQNDTAFLERLKIWPPSRPQKMQEWWFLPPTCSTFHRRQRMDVLKMSGDYCKLRTIIVADAVRQHIHGHLVSSYRSGEWFSSIYLIVWTTEKQFTFIWQGQSHSLSYPRVIFNS